MNIVVLWRDIYYYRSIPKKECDTMQKKKTEHFDYDRAKEMISKELHSWLYRIGNTSAQADCTLEKNEAMNVFDSLALIIPIWLERITLQNSVDSDISCIFQPLKKVKRFSIQSIQSLAEVFLKEYSSVVNTFYKNEKIKWLDDADIDYLGKVATSIYLERWLEKDRKSKKTINAFSKYGYGDKESAKLDKVVDETEKTKRLYRAYDKYCELFALRQVQAKADQEHMPVAAYKRNNKTACDLITLSWCDAWEKSYLQILEFWFFRKHFINRKSKRDSKQNETLHDLLVQYNQLLWDINDCISEAGSDPNKNMEYVAKCILIQKIERVYHFQLVLDILHYCHQSGLDYQDLDRRIMIAHIGRFSELGGLYFDSINTLGPDGKKKYVMSNDSLGVLNNEDLISKLVGTHTEELTEVEISKEIMRRRALMDLLLIMYTVFPFEQQHAWTQVDFENAATFYKETYPLIRTYISEGELPNPFLGTPDEKEKAHCFYDMFHAYYMEIYNMDASPLKDAVMTLTRKK